MSSINIGGNSNNTNLVLLSDSASIEKKDVPTETKSFLFSISLKYAEFTYDSINDLYYTKTLINDIDNVIVFTDRPFRHTRTFNNLETLTILNNLFNIWTDIPNSFMEDPPNGVLVTSKFQTPLEILHYKSYHNNSEKYVKFTLKHIKGEGENKLFDISGPMHIFVDSFDLAKADRNSGEAFGDMGECVCDIKLFRYIFYIYIKYI